MLTSRSRITTLLAVAAVAVAACGTAAKPPVRTPTPSPSPAATATPTATPATPAPSMAAPLLVQIENLSAARPQSGLSQADIVYEYQTEGGISRFTAIFFHLPSGSLGPVRSARLVTIKLLRAYEGTLLFSGASQYVARLLDTSGLRHYNETTSAGTLFRIGSRVAPHNLYTNGAHLAAFEQRLGQHLVGYQLWDRTPLSTLPPGGVPAARFQVPISQSERPIFTYDPATGSYTRTEPDTGQLNDADGNVAWRPTNVVILQMPISIGPEVEDVSGTHGLDFGLVGGGAGQLAVGGQVYSLTYTQGPTSGPPQLTLANGQPAPIAPGQVLIELVGSGQAIS
jgi:Protein of unknown function (DUF3048) N-terminal domain/Protein of unknown function (DUF3048) C-terminal domain